MARNYAPPPPGWENVFMTDSEDVKKLCGGISIGKHIETGKYCVSTTNVGANSDSFLMMPREVLVEIRDALNKELAS